MKLSTSLIPHRKGNRRMHFRHLRSRGLSALSSSLQIKQQIAELFAVLQTGQRVGIYQRIFLYLNSSIQNSIPHLEHQSLWAIIEEVWHFTHIISLWNLLEVQKSGRIALRWSQQQHRIATSLFLFRSLSYVKLIRQSGLFVSSTLLVVIAILLHTSLLQ